jgi:hypothetical protein
MLCCDVWSVCLSFCLSAVHKFLFQNSPLSLSLSHAQFKRRSKKRVTSFNDVAPLDKATDCPEGLDHNVWQRLVDLRNQKIESEVLVYEKASELAHVLEFQQHRQAEVQACVEQVSMGCGSE